MRLPIIIAAGLVLFSFGYKYYAKDKVPEVKDVFSWSFIIILLAVLGNTSIASFIDIFSYIVILIIVLNDGYDFVQGI